jgi:hypothetical protein
MSDGAAILPRNCDPSCAILAVIRPRDFVTELRNTKIEGLQRRAVKYAPDIDRPADYSD